MPCEFWNVYREGRKNHAGKGRVGINPAYWPVVHFAFLLVTLAFCHCFNRILFGVKHFFHSIPQAPLNCGKRGSISFWLATVPPLPSVLCSYFTSWMLKHLQFSHVFVLQFCVNDSLCLTIGTKAVKSVFVSGTELTFPRKRYSGNHSSESFWILASNL